MPLHHVKELLGHSNISTTDTYLDNAGRVHLHESMLRLEAEGKVCTNFAQDPPSQCTAPGFLDTRLRYAAWRSSYSSRASSGVRYASFSRRQHWL